MSECPKCGAAALQEQTWGVEWGCGSIRDEGGEYQSPRCRIAELERENAETRKAWEASECLRIVVSKHAEELEAEVTRLHSLIERHIRTIHADGDADLSPDDYGTLLDAIVDWVDRTRDYAAEQSVEVAALRERLARVLVRLEIAQAAIEAAIAAAKEVEG